MPDNLTIYVGTFSPGEKPSDAGYVQMQLGRAAASLKFGEIGDDTGHSISERNQFYCELTGLYWIWKNDLRSEYVGMVHYRRFLAAKELAVEFSGLSIASSADFTEFEAGADIIVPEFQKFYVHNTAIPLSVRQQYEGMHVAGDLYLAREVISKSCPEYLSAYDFVLDGNSISPFNMFVGKKLVIDRYCEWLFGILFELENQIPSIFYDRYQSRAIGFLAERLFNVWLTSNRSNVKIATRPFVA